MKMQRYPKNRRTTAAFKNIAESVLIDIDQLFDLFCKVTSPRKKLQKNCKVKMQQLDFQLYEDQKEPRIGKCLDTAEEFEVDVEFLKVSYKE